MARFSRYHYRRIAEVIHGERCRVNTFEDPVRHAAGTAVLHHAASRLADLFEADNARFSRARFAEACGWEEVDA